MSEIKCPKCGIALSFIYAERGWAYCPSCGEVIGRPKDFEGLEVRKKFKIESEEDVTTAKSANKDREEEKISIRDLVEEPKSPADVLDEILEVYGVNETFRKWMYRRAQRLGIIQPLELQHYLLSMKSGIKLSGEAAMIVDEYVAALEEERKKAERLGRDYPSITAVSNYRQQNVSAPIYIIPRRNSLQQPSTYTNYQAQYQTQRSTAIGEQQLTAERVVQIVQNLLQEREKDRKIEELESRLHELQMKQIEMIQQMKNEFVQSLKQMGIVTREELEKRKKDELIELYKHMFEEKERRMNEGIKELASTLQTTIKEWKEERQLLLQEVEKARKEAEGRKMIEGYKTDEARLISDAADKLVRLAEARKPIEVVVSLVRDMVNTPKPIKGKSEELVDLLPQDMIEEE